MEFCGKLIAHLGHDNKRPANPRKLVQCLLNKIVFKGRFQFKQMLEIKFALAAHRSASSTPECAKSISKHNEKERRTGCANSRRAAVHPILKEVFSRGPVANLVGNPLRNLLFDVLGWLFLVAPHGPIRRNFGGNDWQQLSRRRRDSVLNSIVEPEKLNRMPEITTRSGAFPIEETCPSAR